MKSVSTQLANEIWSKIRHQLEMSDSHITKQTGIYHDELLVEKGRIDKQRYGKLLSLTESCGFQLGSEEEKPLATMFKNYPDMVSALLNAPTLYDSLCCLKRYRGLIGETDTMEFKFDNDYLLIEYKSDFNELLGAKAAAYNFWFIDELVSQYDKGKLAHREVMLNDRLTINEVDEVKNLYSGRFNVGENNIFKIDLEALYRPNIEHNSILQPHVITRLESSLCDLQSRNNYTNEIIKLIQEYLLINFESPHGADKLSHWICERLYITRWTLNRRLQQEGSCLTSLYTLVRCNEARRLLQDNHHSLIEISQQLGFANQSGFNRFFREQVQCTPMQYRKRLTGYNG
ncbi:helix-turn-helix transcriptional regulator [Vibrio sp. YIC-376]|uniref:helix-turn-helix transcriptional regulator n=1 Tax=Vibrio sp. YIC-376 TaxID=3136162 RepID=UPI00402A8AE8